MLKERGYRFSAAARGAFEKYIATAPDPAVLLQCALDPQRGRPIRLRQAERLVSDLDRMLDVADLETIDPTDVLASRVFSGGADAQRSAKP